MEADQRNRTEAKEEKATVDVVQFEGKPDIKLTKRQSFAVASAFDAINERHPIVVLDHLQVCQLELGFVVQLFIILLSPYSGP